MKIQKLLSTFHIGSEYFHNKRLTNNLCDAFSYYKQVFQTEVNGNKCFTLDISNFIKTIA